MAGSSKGFWETSAGILTAIAGVVTALTGLLVALHELGAVGGGPPPQAAADPPVAQSAPPAPAGEPPAVAGNALTAGGHAPAPPRSPPDLSGYWRDASGTVYEIVQTAPDRYRFSSLNPASGVASQGFGTIDGWRFTSEFQTNLPSVGSGSGTISEDGRRIEGDFVDSLLGSYSTVLFR